ncbi:MAG: hypothetical protein LBR48_09310 [Dysgonamonadaceae bacterium]|jgi:hypothetical protein|nr:hypothetical protein [Dysgonamonadaceae bacterium]
MEQNKKYAETHSVCYKIAGLKLRINSDEPVDWDCMLPSCAPFRQNFYDRENTVCEINVKYGNSREIPPSAKLLTEISDLFAYRIRVLESENHYIIARIYEENCHSLMISDKNFEKSDVYLYPERQNYRDGLSLFLMMAFAQTVILHKTVLLHASVVVKDGFGYAFLGKSGTGKSTHSSLWMRHIEGTKLLNDDNPALRIGDDGEIYICGTPWSGKTPCYINEWVKLKALVRLEQAPQNRFLQMKGANAMISLLPSCSSMRWNNKLYSTLCGILEETIQKTTVARLECLPNADAACLCYEEIQRITNN